MLLSGFEKFEFDQIQGNTKYKDMKKLYNRQCKYNVGSSCDVWSLGCLLYELYVGEFLFYDKDWSVFFEKITSEDYKIFNKEFKNRIDNNLFIGEIIKYILNRNPQQRPSVKNIKKKLKAIFRILNFNIDNFIKINQEPMDMGKKPIEMKSERIIKSNYNIPLKLRQSSSNNHHFFKDQEFSKFYLSEYLDDSHKNIKGFWVYYFLGISWVKTKEFQNSRIQIFRIKDENSLADLLNSYLQNLNNDNNFIEFYVKFQIPFIKFLKILKISLKNQKKVIIQTKTGIIGILLLTLTMKLKQEYFTLEDFI